MKRVTIDIDDDYGLLSLIYVDIDWLDSCAKHILMSRRKERAEGEKK